MKKIQQIRNKRYERGVALMFSLGILGLMVVLAMTFASVSMTNQETTENSASEYTARSLADMALARSLYVMNSSYGTSSYTFSDNQFNLSGSLRSSEIVSGGDAANISSSQVNPNREDFDYLWKLVPEKPSSDAKKQIQTGLDTGYHTDFVNSIRFRVMEGFGKRPEDSKLADAGGSASLYDGNKCTTPFWQYVRDPVKNEIIGRFAYLAYRPHGLLDFNAFTDTSVTGLKRLGLSPAEMSMSSLNDSAVSGQDVYGRWDNLASQFDHSGWDNRWKFTTASDGLRHLLGIRSGTLPTQATYTSSGNSPDDTNYPKEELALNNLFGKWFRTAEKTTPDIFWYKKESDENPAPYLRFNLNRSKEDWNDLDVVTLTNPDNLHLITDFSKFTVSDDTAVCANATKCIPWFINSDKKKQYQLASNFLAWFRDTPSDADTVTGKGLWGKMQNSNTRVTDSSTIKSAPDWTANMRTPYIREAALKLATTFTWEVVETGEYTPTEAEGGGEKIIYIKSARLFIGVEPSVYVSLIDFFNTSGTNPNTEMKICLPAASTPQIRILLPDDINLEYKTKDGAATAITDYQTGGDFERTKTAITGSAQQYYELGKFSIGDNSKLYATTQTGFASGNVQLNTGTGTSPVMKDIPYSLTRCDFTSNATVPDGCYVNILEKTFNVPTSKTEAEKLTKLTFSLTNEQLKKIVCRLAGLSIALYNKDNVPYDFSNIQESGTENSFICKDTADFSVDVTASATSNSGTFYSMIGFRCRDVRSNLNAKEGSVDNWKDISEDIQRASGSNFYVTGSSDEIKYIDRMRLPAEASYGTFGQGQSGDDSTVDHTLPTYSTRMRPELPAYTTYTGATNQNLYPVPHPWEIGMINRGEAFKTINLTKFNGSTTCNGAYSSAPYIHYGKGGFGNYSDGDANILDQIMVTAKVQNGSTAKVDPGRDSYGKVDINNISYANDPDPASLSGTHATRYAYPNRGNLFAARLLFGNSLKLLRTPVNTYFDSGTSGNMITDGTEYLDGATNGTAVDADKVKNILEGIARYNELVGNLYYDSTYTTPEARAKAASKYKFHTRAELLRNTVNPDTSLAAASSETATMNTQLEKIRTAFIQSESLPDTIKEELFCKTVMMLHAGDATASQPDDELIIFGIAQAIKDTTGTVSVLDLAGDGTFATDLDASASVKGSAYRAYDGTYFNISGLKLYKAFSSYPELSFTNSGISASENSSVLSSTTSGLGIYRVGYDRIISTQRVIGWLRRTPYGKWKLVRVQYVD